MGGGKKRKLNRLGKCDVCKATEAIYTCPRCETVTCSLACVKTHKTQLDCDGVRVRTKFVAADKMNEHNMLSDYRLLEDISRCVTHAESQWAVLEAVNQIVPEILPEKDVQQQTASAVVEKEKSEINEMPMPELGLKQNEPEPQSNKLISESTKDSISGSGTKPLLDKTTILLARANRARNKILKVNEHKVIKTSTVTDVSEKQANNDDDSKLPHNKRDGFAETTSSDKLELDITVGEGQLSQSSIVRHYTSSPKERFKQRNKIRRDQLLKTMKRGGNGKEMALETLRKVSLTRSIMLNILPHRFQKHCENTSFFLQKENCIYWHIKVSFLNANVYTLSLSLCTEKMTVENVLNGCLNQSHINSRKLKRQDPLEDYRKSGISKITVLMAADGLPNSDKKFYELDMSKTLRENFVGKCIVEHPHFCVVIEDGFGVCTVKDEATHNFFGNYAESSESEIEKIIPKLKKRKRTTANNGLNGDESGRESGEISESNDEMDSDTSDSEEELFKESEFRSIYSDLLSTLDK